MRRDRAARGFEVAAQREHERVAVDDAGRWRQESGQCTHLWFESLHVLCGQLLEVRHAVGDSRRADRVELLKLARMSRHEQLAAAPVRYVLGFAVFVESLAAFDAETRFEAAARIVEARVDHLGVARRGLFADRGVLLENDDLATGERKLARDRETNDAGADDDRVGAVAHCMSIPAGKRARILAVAA